MFNERSTVQKFTIISVVLVLVVGIVFLKQQLSTPKSNVKPTQDTISGEKTQNVQTVTVTYGDNGFSPSEITIAKDSTVKFINKSKLPLWVASDPHPEHTDYPEFDSVHGLMEYPDERDDYTFTFDKVGNWKFHNHSVSGYDATETVHPGLVKVKEKL